MKRVKVPHLPSATWQKIMLATLLLLAVLLWIVCIILLIEVTRQLLDMLAFIVDLAQMS